MKSSTITIVETADYPESYVEFVAWVTKWVRKIPEEYLNKAEISFNQTAWDGVAVEIYYKNMEIEEANRLIKKFEVEEKEIAEYLRLREKYKYHRNLE
ncbi:MAG: hypothetical protein GY853_14100 [PVC group bacterium]|nr:hypothetical protein [PVC group bacterium]